MAGRAEALISRLGALVEGRVEREYFMQVTPENQVVTTQSRTETRR
ncbi:hypothetical protein J2S92_000726 [Arthrobacter bambusae]|nr:hypothetical protein [Arthrobacter bambusae]MDQ0235003.1 hypothetical protein [Arthrobacter bambusae]